MVNTLHKNEPREPWWDRDPNGFEECELAEAATALYHALVALRAEPAWETNLLKPFRTEAEVAADEIIEKVQKT